MSTTRRSRRAGLGAVAAVVAAAIALAAGAAEHEGPVALVLPDGPGVALSREVLWDCTVRFEHGGLLSAISADLDGDGLDEVLIHSGMRNEPSHVSALDGARGEELWRAAFPQRSCVMAAGLSGGGPADVVVACGDELLVLDGATGERVAGCRLKGTIGDLALACAGSGPAIVYTAGEKHDDVLVLLAGEDLRELWSRQAVSADGPFAGGFTYPSAADVDGDGRDEVLVAENGNHLLCLSGDGELAWDVGLGRRERLNPEGVVSSPPVVADLLGDGIMELAVGCFAGAVVVMDARTGEMLDRAQFGVESHEPHLANSKIPRFIRDALRGTGEPVNCLTPVELDGSPGSELVAGCSDGFLYAYDPGSGDVIWRFDTLETVYDRCVTLEVAGSPARDLLAWDVEGVYLLDGGTGVALDGFDDVAGAGGLLACDLAGTQELELVLLSPEGGRVTAMSLLPNGSRDE